MQTNIDELFVLFCFFSVATDGLVHGRLEEELMPSFMVNNFDCEIMMDVPRVGHSTFIYIDMYSHIVYT